MRTLDDLLGFVETNCSDWSRTQRQVYIDWVLASIVAVSEGQGIDETALVMFARLRVEILERKEAEELSDGGKFVDLKLSPSYQDLASSLLTGGLSAHFWSLLEEPKNPPLARKPSQWPLALKNVYVAGAMVLAFEERFAEPAIPKTTISNISKDVPKFLHNSQQVYRSTSNLYVVWPKMYPVAHFCAAILTMFPPVSGRVLSLDSRRCLAADVANFVRLAERFEQVVRRSPNVIDEKLIPVHL